MSRAVDSAPQGAATGLYGSEIGTRPAAAAAAELIGTFVLVYGGTAVACATALQRPIVGGPYDSLAVGLAFGLALVCSVAAVAHVSGAHVNPAVTVALAATGKFPWRLVPAYVAAQLVGAVAGAAATWLTFGERARTDVSLAATFPAADVANARAIAVEAIITFVLVFVVVSVATDDRVHSAIAPLAVGLAVVVGVLAAGTTTGGSMNPARTLGPMIVTGRFTDFWVFLVGPLVGALAAAFLYDRFIRHTEKPG